MMYHAESFAKNEFDTYVVGYRGSKPVASLTSLPHVHLTWLHEPPRILSMLPFILGGPLKVVHQVLSILTVLLLEIEKPPEFIIVQNPPSIPTLPLLYLVSLLRGSKLIIDWHNLGYTILALKLKVTHPLVKVAKWIEATFGRRAYAHLFVTDAMREHLEREWGLIGQKVVLHDRPPSHFRRASPQEIHGLFLRLTPLLTASNRSAMDAFLPSYSAPLSTPLTEATITSADQTDDSSPPNKPAAAPGPYSRVGMPSMRSDRPALVVSSTSWTPDEDFGILLEALQTYEQRARQAAGGLPRLWVLITGKGPLRGSYMSQVGKLQEEWRYVRCASVWLEAEDYPVLLGSADFGVCLHSSSSALDLPMKVVDMFGCGLPVCALDFKCLPELVQHGKNGLVFKNADELAKQMEDLLAGFPTSSSIDALRAGLSRPPESLNEGDDHPLAEGTWWTWAQNWNRVVRPLVLSDVTRGGVLADVVG
ncbi:glycosyltransferase family 33 protein [Coniophora puteana RWD-64-598 SS2]|uniref:Chitobiosyldiphosphodolichol beta-mannosyltransferase n=1 Tax=Coniophora puteana (strain RWD-64-598) TaxID=741705 RepID=A0A5M3N4L0_CONPW|nr:glycosyltransferase family 33 protein [Coniophora puteana RWD-64-598 SS2]EIW86333.1 glycosyltransferase family 33 protein [Coniophora puteana RWD-64-598 SS2]